MKRILLLAGVVVHFTPVNGQLPPAKNSFTNSPTEKAGKDGNYITIYAATGSLLKNFYEELAANPSIEHEPLQRGKGVFKAYHVTNNKKFFAGYKYKKLHGIWTSWYPNGQLADSGRFVNNIPDGIWTSWYADGYPRSIRQYDAAKLQYVLQEMRRQHPKASFYGLTEIARTDKYYAYRLLDASYHFKSPYPSLAVTERVDLNTDPAKSTYIPPYSSSLMHGLYMNYYSNGQVKDSGYYKYGLREGAWIEAGPEEGIVSKGMYQKGKKRGAWKYYDRRSKFLYHRQFDESGRIQAD